MSELDVVLKTILYSYPYFEMIIEGLEDLAEYKAITSYKNSNKTLEQMQNILAINGQISKICGLQEIVNRLLAELSPLERLLIEYKFFKATPPKKVNYSARAYFRAQIRVFNKLIEIQEDTSIIEINAKEEHEDTNLDSFCDYCCRYRFFRKSQPAPFSHSYKSMHLHNFLYSSL